MHHRARRKAPDPVAVALPGFEVAIDEGSVLGVQGCDDLRSIETGLDPLNNGLAAVQSEGRAPTQVNGPGERKDRIRWDLSYRPLRARRRGLRPGALARAQAENQHR